jgi:UDP-N-acetyl-D-galactosamine dehydrogenase
MSKKSSAKITKAEHALKGDEKIAVIGLGYVGLPLAVALADHFENVIGFDISSSRVAELRRGEDTTLEVDADKLASSRLHVTQNKGDLRGTQIFIVTVPTPIDNNRQPDLTPLERACKMIAPFLDKGSIIIFESTVYPGVTEEFCGPILEWDSGLICGQDFFLGYSPERINPGDKVNRLETIVKVVSGQDQRTLERIVSLYEPIIDAGLHVAPSIKVAEAAKVIENTQRDVNIALVNELAIIFERMDINTNDVLEAAGTKWNFLPFKPGLVGGHCISVDPYYLTSKAEMMGYHPQLILASRRVNDSMGPRVADKLVKMLVQAGKAPQKCRVAILGLSFKEDVPDLRNSRVPDIVDTLDGYGIEAMVFDPLANAADVKHEYDLTLAHPKDLRDLDAVVYAVKHKVFAKDFETRIMPKMTKDAVLVDIKSAVDRSVLRSDIQYWSL